MHTRILLVGLTLFLVQAGCRTPEEQALAAPSTRIEELGVTGDTGTLCLSFTNPNPLPLLVSYSTHTLSLGEKSIGMIDDEDPIGLPPLGTVSRTVLLSPKIALAAQDYLHSNPGQIHASVKSALQVHLSTDDYISMNSVSNGLIHSH